MKIVHLCLSAFFVDNYSYQENILPKYHVKMGYDVTVIASLFSFGNDGKGIYLKEPSVYYDNAGFKVIRLAYKKPIKISRVLKRYKEFYTTLERESPDIIFSHNVSYVDSKEVCRYIDNHPSVKLYADNHADFINSAHSFISINVLHKIIFKYYVKKMEPYLEKCYGVTPMRCRFLKDMYKIASDKIEFLPMGVDDELIPADRTSVRNYIRSELGLSENDFLIFTGGKIDKRKNIHFLLEALRLLNNPRVHLVICGVLTPTMEYMKRTIDNMINVHYLGWCNSNQVMDNLLASDLVCFPGTHSTLWEQSVGVGVPAIFKKWTEMEHVNVNNNCVFIKGEDVSEIRNCIDSFLVREYYDIIKANALIASRTFLYSEISKKAIGI